MRAYFAEIFVFVRRKKETVSRIRATKPDLEPERNKIRNINKRLLIHTKDFFVF
jgi:hypothetical protein